MHPFWVKKIEEQRRDRNTLFWVVFFLAVVFPICLVGKLDVCLLFSISCFAAAMTRLYYYYAEVKQDEEQKMLESLSEKMDEGNEDSLTQAHSESEAVEAA